MNTPPLEVAEIAIKVAAVVMPIIIEAWLEVIALKNGRTYLQSSEPAFTVLARIKAAEAVLAAAEVVGAAVADGAVADTKVMMIIPIILAKLLPSILTAAVVILKLTPEPVHLMMSLRLPELPQQLIALNSIMV